MITPETKKAILRAQKFEITEYFIYKNIAVTAKRKNDREVLRRIADEELKHHDFWKSISGEKVKPAKLLIFFHTLVAKILGLNFGLRLMEKGEELAQKNYENLMQIGPEVKKIIEDEEKHEQKLLTLISREELKYTGSVILGMNDALVELTGVLAGLTLALQNTNIVAIAGLITGIAASLSMGGSEYLSTKDEGGKNPLKASIYTGFAYIFVVVVLIAPYFLLKNIFASLAMTMILALFIIFIFNFYIAVAKNISFRKRFFEMAGISLGVAVLNFLIGWLVRQYLGIDI